MKFGKHHKSLIKLFFFDSLAILSTLLLWFLQDEDLKWVEENIPSSMADV